MLSKQRPCKTPEVEHVRKFVAYLKSQLNAAGYYPPVRAHRYLVALALYSKCLTVAEATLALLDHGFADEAFGMTRTLVDVFITLHYIANKDTDERAERYYYFFTKDSEQWSVDIQNYWPKSVQALDPRTQKIASTYPHPHRWSGKSVAQMALEPDTNEIDPATGNPTVHDFAYRVIYRWTSHFVHPTIVALQDHLVQAGSDVFTVHRGNSRDMGHLAAFNVACYVSNSMVCFYRCMKDPQPQRVGNWSVALIRHFTRQHIE